MKLRKIAVGLAALSLLAIVFISTVAAADFDAIMGVDRKGKYLTFYILRDNPANAGFPFDSVDLTQITLVIQPHGYPTTTILYPVPADLVLRDATGITFTIDKNDLPVNHADHSWATGFLTTGETFSAAGPGWGWANIH